MSTTTPTTLTLRTGLDRSLAWDAGGSVRYLVADLTAVGVPASNVTPPAINLALAIDVSGSMQGEKVAAARDTASAVTRALTARDRLTIVAFNNEATLLLDARTMDDAGERVATAMRDSAKASHRVLLLSDGQANNGVIDPRELAHHAAEALARGIITSAVGIGDDFDEALLGGMSEAGGGRMHDAEHTEDISEVVLGELLEGRSALLERASLRFVVPANVRAEVVGPWSHTVLPGAVEVMLGSLLPQSPKRVVLRLHCPGGRAGTRIPLSATARDNTPQRRDTDRSVAAFTAWQSDAMRRTVNLNREGDRRGAKHYLSRELRWMEPYARDLPGSEPLLAELLLRRADEELDTRTRKDLYGMSLRRGRSEMDLRSAPDYSATTSNPIACAAATSRTS